MSENYIHEADNGKNVTVYEGKATKTGKSVAWGIGEWGGNYAEARTVNVFTSVDVPALRAAAYNLAQNAPFERQDGRKVYPQAFLAQQAERALAFVGRDGEYEVYAIPGLAVKAPGFENWLNLDEKVIVSRKAGKRGAAQMFADRIAAALTKSVFIAVPKRTESDVPAVDAQAMAEAETAAEELAAVI